MRTILILFTCGLLYTSCTPYDSNKVNMRLIQGKWSQVEIMFPDQNGATIDKPDGITYLTFSGDSCKEEMPDIRSTRLFSFQIHDYILKLEEEGHPDNVLGIYKLTEDSLILNINKRYWKYIKQNQN